ncbi:MAG: hypothetical protein V4710_10460 [Verrucomicrobiota bacterium]
MSGARHGGHSSKHEERERESNSEPDGNILKLHGCLPDDDGNFIEQLVGCQRFVDQWQAGIGSEKRGAVQIIFRSKKEKAATEMRTDPLYATVKDIHGEAGNGGAAKNGIKIAFDDFLNCINVIVNSCCGVMIPFQHVPE